MLSIHRRVLRSESVQRQRGPLHQGDTRHRSTPCLSVRVCISCICVALCRTRICWYRYVHVHMYVCGHPLAMAVRGVSEGALSLFVSAAGLYFASESFCRSSTSLSVEALSLLYHVFEAICVPVCAYTSRSLEGGFALYIRLCGRFVESSRTICVSTDSLHGIGYAGVARQHGQHHSPGSAAPSTQLSGQGSSKIFSSRVRQRVAGVVYVWSLGMAGERRDRTPSPGFDLLSCSTRTRAWFFFLLSSLVWSSRVFSFESNRACQPRSVSAPASAWVVLRASVFFPAVSLPFILFSFAEAINKQEEQIIRKEFSRTSPTPRFRIVSLRVSPSVCLLAEPHPFSSLFLSPPSRLSLVRLFFNFAVGGVTCLAFSDDGALLGSYSMGDCTMRLWQVSLDSNVGLDVREFCSASTPPLFSTPWHVDLQGMDSSLLVPAVAERNRRTC